ncbi:MAG: cation-transporting P-type ATPase, partial [Clostridia bacterium]|nr:cation-transporting P-type ATPase [Clostridia bacterium]
DKRQPNTGPEEAEELLSPEQMHPVDVAEALESDLLNGLTDKQVRRARRVFGRNELKSGFKLSFRESLKNQFKGLIGLFLAVASLLMFAFRPDEPVYLCMAAVVTAVMLLNAFAEYRASKSLQVPRKYSSLKAHVVRGGEEQIVDSMALVPGDLIIVERGSVVPADCRLVDDFGLTVLETHVSGSDGSVAKDSRYLARGGIEPVCANMIYAGSIVTAGHGSAIVCRTGRDTLMRRMHPETEEYVPGMLKYVKNLCRITSVTAAIICFLLLLIGVAAGADITEWFICALAIGASSLCDSMVSLCAGSLGSGAKRMANDGMVVKNYGKLQTLAGVNTVMCGRNLAFPPKRISLTGFFLSNRAYDRAKRPDAQAEELLKLMLACSDAKRTSAAEKKQKHGLPEYRGTPLDNAVVEYFEEWNKQIGNIREQYIRMDAEYTLSGDVARLLALHNGRNTVIVRGSPENVLSRCVGYTLDGTDYRISDFTRRKILSAAEDYSRTNSFLVAVACGETQADTLRGIEAEQSLIFKGFVSFSSSLSPGVAEAVYRCNGADIETVLNSDDAYYPALNSAKSAGIIQDENQILTAEQLRSCDRGLLIANCPYYKLFLNIDDAEWLDIVKMRRENGRIAAVTAERINELPIMREADVSIVPENSGDTLRQTADMLMLDRGINLIAEGILNAKTIVKRIRSVVTYLLAGIVMLFSASVFSASYDQTPAFRAQDVMFGGIIFNLAFAFALAYAPRSTHTLKEKFDILPDKVRLTDFIYPLMFSIGGGIVLFVCFVATQSYTCSLLALTAMLFVFACTCAGHGGVFVSKRFGNTLLFLVGAGAALVLAALIFTKPGHSLFGYGVPDSGSLLFTAGLCLAYCLITQILRYFFSPHGNGAKKAGSAGKKQKSKAKSQRKKIRLFGKMRDSFKRRRAPEEKDFVFDDEEGPEAAPTPPADEEEEDEEDGYGREILDDGDGDDDGDEDEDAGDDGAGEDFPAPGEKRGIKGWFAKLRAKKDESEYIPDPDEAEEEYGEDEEAGDYDDDEDDGDDEI